MSGAPEPSTRRRRAFAIYHQKLMLFHATWAENENRRSGRYDYLIPTEEYRAKAKGLLGDIRRLYGEGEPEPSPFCKDPSRICANLGNNRYWQMPCRSECPQCDDENGMTDAKAFQILRDAVDEKEAGDRIADATESPCGLAGTTATRERAAQRAIGRRPVFKVFLEQRLRRMEVNQELILHGQRTGLHGQRAILFGQQTILAKLAIQATAMERITATMCNRSAQ
jgi:hypothetical protein